MNKKMYFIFENWSEQKQLIAGFLITVFGSLLSAILHIRYVGLMNLTPFSVELPIYVPLIDNLINIFALTFCLFLLGRGLNKRTRLIDIFSLSMIWRGPLYLGSLFNINGFLDKQMSQLMEQITSGDMVVSTLAMAAVLIIAAVTVTLLVFSVWLLYAGFHTATNGKNNKQVVFFVLGVFIAFILTQIIFQQFSNSLHYSL